ncbi:16085_t:CDS:2 [Racocetra persica]|uniref:16085_t:CDS:1 n=1 Tax=Racocetra persica TaxID=160502 RepID=A0ACA9MJG5_9GLOM|nr:16085_t:CDS:2 [Racocetra persica]
MDETKLKLKNQPKKNREKETKLNVYCRHLEGTLNLSDFSDLKELDYRNLLTNLTLTNDLTNLKHLDLSSNNFSAEQNLSFLVGATSLEYLYLGIYNRFTGSLDYLNEMEKLRELNISNTDINEVDINKLPKSLESIEYSIELRPSCKLTTIVPQLEKYGKYGRCKKCQQPNTSKNRCQPCVDEE